jgi:hypothetical protein
MLAVEGRFLASLERIFLFLHLTPERGDKRVVYSFEIRRQELRVLAPCS